MDAERFDRLSVALARGLSRRTIGSAAAATVWAFLRQEAAAQDACGGCYEGEVCRDGHCWRACASHRDCRSRQNDDPCVNNSCIDGVCVMAIVDCQPGFECCYGECCSKRCETDEECAVFDPCRTGACVNGVCAFEVVEHCNPCESDPDCINSGLNTTCCGGMCRRPCIEGMTMGKGCECLVNADGTGNGLIVREDASGDSGAP